MKGFVFMKEKRMEVGLRIKVNDVGMSKRRVVLSGSGMVRDQI